MEITRVRVSTNTPIALRRYPTRGSESQSCPPTGKEGLFIETVEPEGSSIESITGIISTSPGQRQYPSSSSISLGGAGAATAEGKLNSGFGLPNFDSSTKFQRSHPRPWRQFRLLEPAPPPMETAHKLCPSRVYGQSPLRPGCRNIWGLATPVSAPPPNFGGAGIVLGSNQRSLCRLLHRIPGEPVLSLAFFNTH